MSVQTPESADTPQLVTRFRLPALVLFGLAYMAPFIVVATFGVVSVATDGATPSAYIITTCAMLLTAVSYGKMARLFPKSGSVYTYARKLLGSHIGFLAGWAILLDYLFLPMVAWLLTSTYLNAQFPAVPVWAWLLINIALTTAINIYGVVLADRVNKTFTTLVLIGLAVFMVLCMHYLAVDGHSPAGDAFWNSTTTIPLITAGAAIAAYSYLGFDAISTLSEETHQPERTVPRAIVLTVLIGGVLFTVVSFLMQWAHPGATFANIDAAGYEVSILVAGKTFTDILNAIACLGGFVSGLTIQTGTSRLLYVMGRDGVLPQRFFGKLHPTFRTPVPSLLLIAAAGLLGLGLSLASATSLINFGAFVAFTLVNLCVISYAIGQRRAGNRLSVLGHFVVPAAGAAIDFYLLTALGVHALVVGSIWLVLGVVYLAVLTGGFRRQPPEFAYREGRTSTG